MSFMEEQEKSIWSASRKYVRGEISLEELKAIELPQAERFIAAIYTFARYSSRHSFWNVFFQFKKLL